MSEAICLFVDLILWLWLSSKIIQCRLSKVFSDIFSKGRVINNSSDYLCGVMVFKATIKMPISFASGLDGGGGIVDPFLGTLWESMWVVLMVWYVAHGS